MFIRFKIWRARRRTVILSKHSELNTLVAYVNNVPVGKFRKGREVT